MSLKTIFETINPNLKLIPELTVKCIKSFRGHEGEPLLQGDLYVNNKKTAFIGDDSHGGGFNLQPYGKTTYPQLEELLEKIVDAKKFPDVSSWAKEGAIVEYDDYISDLLESTNFFMKARRVRKTTTHIFNPKTFAFGTVKCPVEHLDEAWFKENLDDGDIVLSKLLD